MSAPKPNAIAPSTLLNLARETDWTELMIVGRTSTGLRIMYSEPSLAEWRAMLLDAIAGLDRR